eukprot:maker-scaffold941_size78300-snap-gene-0.21 protein:Tk00812 transcript:maker-scaffold941_size78300-snap-gene-0.21-mRNA-1 annotation:"MULTISPECIES: hypothetical protein"
MPAMEPDNPAPPTEPLSLPTVFPQTMSPTELQRELEPFFGSERLQHQPHSALVSLFINHVQPKPRLELPDAPAASRKFLAGCLAEGPREVTQQSILQERVAGTKRHAQCSNTNGSPSPKKARLMDSWSKSNDEKISQKRKITWP